MRMNTRLISTSFGTNRQAFTALDWGLFFALVMIWGSSFLLMAIGLDTFHPGLVTLVRVGSGALFLALIRGSAQVEFEPEDKPKVLLLAVAWIAVPLTLFPIAQQWIDSAIAGMLNGVTPVFTMVLAAFLLKSMPRMVQMVGVILGGIGIAAIAGPSAGQEPTAALGVGLVLVATIGYAISLNMAAPLQQKYGAVPLVGQFLMISTALVAPYGLYGLTQSTFSLASLLAVLATGVFGTGLAFIMMSRLVGRVGAPRASFLTYLIPAVALVLGVTFRDESISPIAIGGVVAVVVGAYMASRREIIATDG